MQCMSLTALILLLRNICFLRTMKSSLSWSRSLHSLLMEFISCWQSWQSSTLELPNKDNISAFEELEDILVKKTVRLKVLRSKNRLRREKSARLILVFLVNDSNLWMAMLLPSLVTTDAWPIKWSYLLFRAWNHYISSQGTYSSSCEEMKPIEWSYLLFRAWSYFIWVSSLWKVRFTS